MSLPVHTLYGVSLSKGVEGYLFITYTVVISASAQNVVDSFSCENMLRTLSMKVQFILSASPFSSVVFGTVYPSQIPVD